MRSFYVFFLIISMLPVVLWKPHVGVLVWSWISYMNPHRLTYGFAYDFNFLDFVAACTLIAAFLTTEPKRLPRHPLVWLIAIYYLWTGLTTLTAPDISVASGKWFNFSKVILFTFITLIFMQSKNRLIALIWVLMLSMGFFALKGGVFTILTGGSERVWGPPKTFIASNNEFAMAVLMAIPLVYFLSTTVTSKYLKWALLLAIPIGFMSIFGTQSRGGLVGIVCVLLFLAWQAKRLMLGLIVMGFVGVVAFLFMPDSWRDRMATIENYEEDASAQGRLDMWAYAIDVANDRPIVGGGFDIFYNNYYRFLYLPEGVKGRAAHSAYFEVLGEHGYVGLTLFLLMGITAFFTCGAIIQRSRAREELAWAGTLAKCVRVGLVGFATSGAFLTCATFDFLYHLLAITAILRILLERELAKEAAPGSAADPQKTKWAPANWTSRPSGRTSGQS
jgi:probable O-glycosylation ligase (exosortase A-associated)